MKAIVTEIQVGGGVCVNNLEQACADFMSMVRTTSDTGYRAKLNFAITLPNGETKHITIRDEDNETVAYGDFDGLPNVLDYAKEVIQHQ